MMRLASYNILDGGEGRADPIAEVLLAQQADVIAIIEADNPDVLDRLSRRLSMDYVTASGDQHAAALFSRWPILDSINIAAIEPAGPRSFVVADVVAPGFDRPIRFGALHLHPRADEADEEIRVSQLQVVLNSFASERAAQRPHVLMGDFNANSPLQNIDPERCKPSTRESWRKNGDALPRRAIQLLLDHGYIDTLAAADLPSARGTGSFSTQFPGQRVDYIFTHGIEPGRIRKAWIEQDRLAKYASDHFPAGCEIA